MQCACHCGGKGRRATFRPFGAKPCLRKLHEDIGKRILGVLPAVEKTRARSPITLPIVSIIDCAKLKDQIERGVRLGQSGATSMTVKRDFVAYQKSIPLKLGHNL